jgi:hypothetical protein
MDGAVAVELRNAAYSKSFYDTRREMFEGC